MLSTIDKTQDTNYNRLKKRRQIQEQHVKEEKDNRQPTTCGIQQSTDTRLKAKHMRQKTDDNEQKTKDQRQSVTNKRQRDNAHQFKDNIHKTTDKRR